MIGKIRRRRKARLSLTLPCASAQVRQAARHGECWPRRNDDGIFGRILERHLPYWADPSRREQGRINTWDGGRGVYFDDPNGHLLEAITRSYGTGGTTTDRPHPLVASREKPVQ